MRSISLFLALFVAVVNGDVYLHNPRGGNNRLNGNGRNRRNANRMFDSQNNDRGGYNVGSMYYYAGSEIPIEWTNQHSCSDDNNHCEIILQYMCGPNVRDGTTTKTIPDNSRRCKNKDCNNDLQYGMHEDYNYYQRCQVRSRDTGLFTADQTLKGNSARYTRQNAQGTRRGYECPEERDYYPYWGASEWKDIVVFTDDTSRCKYYQKESQNVKDRYECRVDPKYLDLLKRRKKVLPLNKEDCETFSYKVNRKITVTAQWVKIEAHKIPAPECKEAPWSRDNHNGNGLGGEPNTYLWRVPDIKEENCVLRIRYNISTGDYDGWDTDSSLNAENGQVTKVDIASQVNLDLDSAEERGFIFENDPELQVVEDDDLKGKLVLKLAINTAQFSRTFQDRTHSFAIRERPSELSGKRIVNVNVRGKRGNIVQVYPAVEYDYVPNEVHMEVNDYIHFQWTGSDSNPKNNAGQGKKGTDRSNVVLLKGAPYKILDKEAEGSEKKYGHWAISYPQHLDKTVFLGLSREDLVKLAILKPDQLGGNMKELDDASPYFDLKARKVTRIGTFYYMCTRNNNFSNRSQKGKIVVHRKGDLDGATKRQEQFHDGSSAKVKETREAEKVPEAAEHKASNTQAAKQEESQASWVNNLEDAGNRNNMENKGKGQGQEHDWPDKFPSTGFAANPQGIFQNSNDMRKADDPGLVADKTFNDDEGTSSVTSNESDSPHPMGQPLKNSKRRAIAYKKDTGQSAAGESSPAGMATW